MSKYTDRLSIPRDHVVQQVEEEYGVKIPRGVIERDVNLLKEIASSVKDSAPEETEAALVEIRRQLAVKAESE